MSTGKPALMRRRISSEGLFEPRRLGMTTIRSTSESIVGFPHAYEPNRIILFGENSRPILVQYRAILRKGIRQEDFGAPMNALYDTLLHADW
jgi:hypothetical protein